MTSVRSKVWDNEVIVEADPPQDDQTGGVWLAIREGGDLTGTSHLNVEEAVKLARILLEKVGVVLEP